MKKIILILFVFLCFLQLNAIIEESADLLNFFFSSEPDCAYSKWESHIVEGLALEGYNMYAPYDRQTEGFGQFTLPSGDQEDAWEEAVDYFFAGQYNLAHTTFAQNNIPYSVVKFTDETNIYYMLRENLNASYIDNNGTTPSYDDEIGSFDFGWGIFVYRTTNPAPIVVTAPHPNDDFISPKIAVESFLEYNAQYLMINGSGREVMWSESGNYNNGKSFSDPTRNHNHPFNYFYKKACDKIREDFDRRELSVQIHSYDWDSHPGRESCQISPGQYKRPAGLPIRDFSPLQQDVIQNTDYIVIPQGTIGNNEEVTVREYYSVHSGIFDTVYQDTLIISGNVDLPGYSNSYHDIYSTDNYSDWDIFSPFFHVEFDELPNCYPQTEESFKDFYGYNTYTNNWNISQKYTKVAQYYQPYVDALGLAIESWIELDDGEVPEAPANLRRSYGSSGNVIAWDPVPCYDFYSYEILLSQEPISQGEYTVIDRSDIQQLAFPKIESITLQGLALNQTYYIAMRAVDYNGNTSAPSEELTYISLPIITSEFDFFADNSSIDIEWTMNQQQNCTGFEIYRSQDESDFVLYSSYTNNPGLDINSTYYEDFNYSDENVELGHRYAYRVNVVNNAGQSSQISQIMNASLTEYISLTASGNYWDTSVTFGKSYFATPEFDNAYDLLATASNTYLALGNNNEEFTRNIISEFEPTEDVFYLDVIINNPPTNLTFNINTPRNSERFYLLYNNEIYSLNSESAELYFPGNGVYNAQLIWGNFQSQVLFSIPENTLLYQGDSVDLAWNIDYPELAQSMGLYFKNEQDSILIVENLSPEQTSFTFTNNINEDYRMINLYASIVSSDNQILSYNTYNKFVLVSEIIPMNFEASSSNQLISYPFTVDFPTTTLVGSIEAFALIDDEFINTDIFNSNSGYFLNIMNDCQLEYNGTPFLGDNQYLLERGWNLIYNPHPFDYEIQNLLFDKNGNIRSFKSAVESNYIMPNVIGVRDGCYTAINTLKAFESVFLNKSTNDALSIRFDPVIQSEDFNLMEPELFFTLEFKSASGAKDELTVGLQSGLTDILDFYYDLMEAPLRPTYGLKEAYIVTEPPLSNYYPKMNTKFQEPTNEDDYSWDIAFTNTLAQAIQVRIKADNNMNNYPLDLHFGGNTYRLNDNYLTLADSDESGTYFAELSIMTVTDNEDNEVEAINQFSITPNPISKEAQIKVNNNKNGDFSVSIYNIRGQKVKDFDTKDFKTDNSVFTWNLHNNNGRRVSSGIYFVRYKDETNTKTKKICVIK